MVRLDSNYIPKDDTPQSSKLDRIIDEILGSNYMAKKWKAEAKSEIKALILRIGEDSAADMDVLRKLVDAL